MRIGIDLNIFEIVTKPTSLNEITEKTDAEPAILRRILRALCSIGFLKQIAVTKWEPTPITFAINKPALRDWVIAHFDQRVLVSERFPQWLKKRGYKSTGAIDDNAFTETYRVPIWEWYEKNPEAHAIFNSAMSIQESFPKEMRPQYPFKKATGEVGADPNAVTLVDIGGGFGQAIKNIRKEYPGLKGRFILQDLPKTIDQIDATQAKEDGFELHAYDFFNPQPIKGAKFYHLRRVLHDWNDESSIKILDATYAAMKDTPHYSTLLIHEFVLPDVDCGFSEAMIDLTMMQICDGKERTESDWHEILGKTGFKIIRIWKAKVGTTAIIEAVIL